MPDIVVDITRSEYQPVTPGGGKDPVSVHEMSARGRKIVAALNEFADDLEAGGRIESKFTVRQVRVIRSFNEKDRREGSNRDPKVH